jgi:hypothetical protein
MAVATDAGANTVFNFGNGNTLTIVGQNTSDLSESNFAFTSMATSEPLGNESADIFAADMVDVFDMDVLIQNRGWIFCFLIPRYVLSTG